jgi:aryl-alcohol dehydrogenase-like predicted oxidoreductase
MAACSQSTASTPIDTADGYSGGESEEILGKP